MNDFLNSVPWYAKVAGGGIGIGLLWWLTPMWDLLQIFVVLFILPAFFIFLVFVVGEGAADVIMNKIVPAGGNAWNERLKRHEEALEAQAKT